MKISNLILTFLFIKVIEKLTKKIKKKKSIEPSPIAEMTIAIVMFICGAARVIVAITFLIMLFF